MSIGADLLQEWLNLRSNARVQKKFWDDRRRTQKIVDIVKGDKTPVSDGKPTRMGSITSTLGTGTNVGIPYDLLSAKQKRGVKRIQADLSAKKGNAEFGEFIANHPDPNYRDLAMRSPALAAMDHILGGQLLSDERRTAHDIDVLGSGADLTAAVAENPTLYFWGTDAMLGALEASKSLPPESSIIADLYAELPRRGMWLFETPMSLPTSSYDSHVAGLLWDLSAKGLWMTTLVRADRTDLLHSTGTLTGTYGGWFPAEVSLRDLEEWSRQLYRNTYEGSPYEASDEGQLMGEDAHVAIGMQMSKFWLAAVEWMKQRVLVRSRPTRILPKNKKRARKMEAQVQGEMPTIEIVQLRRTESGPSEASGQERHYSMRFIVHGHFRNQYYPSRGVHAPKWISSYVKGPQNAPLKESIRAYAVTR